MTPDDPTDGDDVFGIDTGEDEDQAPDDGGVAPIVAPGHNYKQERGETPEEKGVQHLFQALVSRVPRPKAKRLVVETYGKGPRGAPNVKAAAAEIGVHPSTVRRWIRSGMPKKSPAADQLRSKWENSPAGRRASVSPDRRKAIREPAPGAVFSGTLTGHIWVDTDNEVRNGDERSFNFTMDPAKARQLNQALLDGEDEKALEILESSVDGFGSEVGIDLTNFSWKGMP